MRLDGEQSEHQVSALKAAKMDEICGSVGRVGALPDPRIPMSMIDGPSTGSKAFLVACVPTTNRQLE